MGLHDDAMQGGYVYVPRLYLYRTGWSEVVLVDFECSHHLFVDINYSLCLI